MEKKLKIVHIAQSAGGVENYIYMLLSNLKREQYDNILIISEDYKKDEERFKNLISKIYYVPMQRNINFKSIFLSVKKVKKILKEVKPDIVYMHSSMAGGVGRIATLFNKKVKKIYNAHGWYFNAEIGKKKRKIYEILERILARNTDMIVNISQSEYDSAIQRKIAPKEKMCIINNGIDFKKFEFCEKYRIETRKSMNISDDEIVIGVVGRISAQKDPITTIKAFKEVHKKYSKTKLIYIGSGDLEEDVRKIAIENNIDKDIIITGWIENTEKYISALDIALLPSKWEGFGLAIIEYMACKKPIVATNVGGIKNIICDETKGLLVEMEDVQGICNDICYYIENKKYAITMTENNYVYAKENYNIENVVREHEEKIFSIGGIK